MGRKLLPGGEAEDHDLQMIVIVRVRLRMPFSGICTSASRWDRRRSSCLHCNVWGGPQVRTVPWTRSSPEVQADGGVGCGSRLRTRGSAPQSSGILELPPGFQL